MDTERRIKSSNSVSLDVAGFCNATIKPEDFKKSQDYYEYLDIKSLLRLCATTVECHYHYYTVSEPDWRYRSNNSQIEQAVSRETLFLFIVATSDLYFTTQSDKKLIRWTTSMARSIELLFFVSVVMMTRINVKERERESA